MSTEHIIAALVAEREKLNRAIEALGGTVGKRRGRPPKALSTGRTETRIPGGAKRKGRPPMSATEKKAASKRMKAFWAARRKAKK
jgi:hypothetical protein